jgi:hypothetical protein
MQEASSVDHFGGLSKAKMADTVRIGGRPQALSIIVGKFVCVYQGLLCPRAQFWPKAAACLTCGTAGLLKKR